MYCVNCGHTLTPADRFCPGCGTPGVASLATPFQRAQDEYGRLTAQLDAGRITAAQMTTALDALQVEHQGAYWSIGERTGRWYRYDGAAWTEATPPAADAAS